jgi:DNA-binding protein Fis
MYKNKNIEVIKSQINNLDSETFDLKSWVLATDNYLKNIWGDNTPKSKQLRAVVNTVGAAMFGYSEEDVIKFKTQWKNLLNSYIIELEDLEKPETVKEQSSNNINLTVNQTQSQSQKQTQKQTIDIEKIIDAFKEELTGKQIKELDLIIKEPDSPEKVRKFTDKLLSFGSNVAASILGNIITNPQIIGLL